MPIATGVATLPEIERNLYQAIRSMRGGHPHGIAHSLRFSKGQRPGSDLILKIQTPWRATAQSTSHHEAITENSISFRHYCIPFRPNSVAP